MRIRLDIKALSVNRAWQGRRFKTQEYKNYEKNALALLPDINTKHKELTITYNFYIKNYAMSDVGNFEKSLSDILVKKGIILDDRYIKKIILIKHKSEKHYIEIDIEKYKGE